MQSVWETRNLDQCPTTTSRREAGRYPKGKKESWLLGAAAKETMGVLWANLRVWEIR